MVFSNSLRLISEEVHTMLFHLSGFGLTNSAAEDVLVLLLGEVNIIVSVRVGEFSGHVSIIFVERVRSKCLTVIPGL